ncbi:MAG: GDP-mannose mannosyl hydrolase [Gammaproteobacteria bacterium]
MTGPAPISDDAFAQVVRHTPLVSIDLIVMDHKGMVLTGLRANEPARGTYFVPGGVIRKNETISDAFARIMQAELGFARNFDEAFFVGLFEHFYDTNRFGHPSYGTHYVVLAYSLELAERPPIKPDAQHRTIRWMTPAEILASPDVHLNTQAYFR